MMRHEEKPCTTLTQPSPNEFCLVFVIETIGGTSHTYCALLQLYLIPFLFRDYLSDHKRFLQMSVPICFHPEGRLVY